MPDSQYPKLPEELQAEVATLKGQLATAESLLRVAGEEMRRQAETIERLRRRKPPRVLDKAATDAFQRPAFSR